MNRVSRFVLSSFLAVPAVLGTFSIAACGGEEEATIEETADPTAMEGIQRSPRFRERMEDAQQTQGEQSAQ